MRHQPLIQHEEGWQAESVVAESAAEETPQVAEEQTTEWNQTLTRQVEQRNRHLRRAIMGFLGYTAAMSLAMLLLKHWIGPERWQENAFSPYLLIPQLLAVFAFVGYMSYNQIPRCGAREAIQKLQEVADVASVGPLIDALKLDDLKVRESARTALIELLPRLQPEDAALLNTAQRAKLCSVLSIPVENPLYKDVAAVFRPAHDRAVNLRVAILQAFAQVGDERALRIVERLAGAEANTHGERRIREAAQQCLPVLQERVRQLNAPSTLLRASAVAESPDILLRPAMEGGATAPGELLRAAPPE